jgi:superfamily II DNA or RNA helicase
MVDAEAAKLEYSNLRDFVAEECSKRLRAYEAQPRDANEHFETENEVLSGGYAYRQLYELVQNAADAILEAGESRGRIYVRLAPDRLEAANTGAALDEGGIVALLNARSSPKRGNQIGRFGIGFKSLLKLGGQVDLISRSVGLRFCPETCRNRIRDHLGLAPNASAPGMRLAEVLDPKATNSPLTGAGKWSWATTVVSAEIADQSAFERLRKEFAEFPAEFLLFLSSDISLELEVVGDEPRRITKRLEDGVAVVVDGANEAKWRVFDTSVDVESQEARSDATHIQARDQVPLTWAVPIAGREQAGRFWAFFPTETPSRAAGILNAPWKLNSDRTNLIRGPWNEAIMRAAAELIGDSLSALPTSDDQGATISAFPRQPERLDEIAIPLISTLWDRIVTSEVLPDVEGTLRKPSELLRHFVEAAEVCNSWADLANVSSRQSFLHPDCYASEARLSRLRALVLEAQRRNVTVLPKSSPVYWLDCIGKTDLASVKQVLVFVGDLLRRRNDYQLYFVPEARIILTTEGRLATPSEAVIVTGAPAPAGFVAVNKDIASDPLCREILVNQMEVKVLAADSWAAVLEASLDAAEVSDASEDWANFWRNVAAAPRDIKIEYLAELKLDRVKFQAVSGKWINRNLLLVTNEISGIQEDYVMDPAFKQSLEPYVPITWLSEFPSSSEMLNRDDQELRAFLRWTSPYFDQVCRERVGRTPQYLPKLSDNLLRMPAAWRLLPHLPPAWTAKLTKQLLEQCEEYFGAKSTVTLVHPTRMNDYPIVLVPHPIFYWLSEHGRLRVGKLTVPLHCFSSEFAKIMEQSRITGFTGVSRFLGAREPEAETESRFSWRNSKLTSESNTRFWEQIFAELAARTTNLNELRPIWELAYSEGAIPQIVPTADGAIPLSEIYVTTELSLGHELDDGKIVLLSAKAVSAWTAAGALPLDSGPSTMFKSRLSDPFLLENLVPEIALAYEDTEAVRSVLTVWVDGLDEGVGPFRYPAVLGIDSDGVLLIDESRFYARGWAERAELILSCLARHGVIESGETLNAILARIVDRRTVDARKAVREQPSIELKVLKAINGDISALFSIFTPATRLAAGDKFSDEEIARLALAVHGPTLLSGLRETLERNGLAPPSRWGGEQARAFVLELGFPVEFASSIAARRDAEMSVSGPISLPSLHDYQEEILANVETLIASGVGRRRAVISLPTGGGKTRVAAEAVVRLILRGDGRRTALWIAQTDELCEQAVQCFRQLWVNVGALGEDLRVVRFWGGQRSPAPPEGDEATVVVASIQTLNSRSRLGELAWIAQSGIVIIDECHHAITSSYTDIMRWLDVQVGNERAREFETPVIGLSATPWRGYNEDESERLAARFDRRWFPSDQASLHEKLSDMGVLATRSYRALRYDRPITLSAREQHHVDTFGELPDSVVDRIGEDTDRNDLIVDTVLKSSATSILLFANSVAHAQYLAARLHLAGCPAAAVSGQTDRLARQHFTRRFRSGELRVICNHSVLTTGFDAPKADLILISRPVISPVLYMQMVGRGLRGPANGGTDHCQIMTVEDNILNFSDRLAHQFCRRFFES